jgi:hypothetical protein
VCLGSCVSCVCVFFFLIYFPRNYPTILKKIENAGEKRVGNIAMEQLKERIEKLERRQEAILNAPILWNNLPSACTRSKTKNVSEEMERDSWATFWSEKKEKEKEREERENLDDLQQMIFDSKTELEDLYKKGIISREEALCRYVMIGTSYWYKDACRYLNASLSQREKINMEKERFEMVNRKIIEKGREKEFDILARQQRIQELESGVFPVKP